MDDRDERIREAPSNDRTTTDGPVGTVLGWSFGPFGAAIGSVVDANRLAFKVSIGSDRNRDGTVATDRGTTIEIDESETTEPGSDDADGATE